jgi:hypothetical protein
MHLCEKYVLRSLDDGLEMWVLEEKGWLVYLLRLHFQNENRRSWCRNMDG